MEGIKLVEKLGRNLGMAVLGWNEINVRSCRKRVTRYACIRINARNNTEVSSPYRSDIKVEFQSLIVSI